MQDIQKATRHRAREIISVSPETLTCLVREASGEVRGVRFPELSKRELVRACVYMHPSTSARVWQPSSPRELRERLVSGDVPVHDPVERVERAPMPTPAPMPADPMPASDLPGCTVEDVKQIVGEAIAAAMGKPVEADKPSGDKPATRHPLADMLVRILNAPCPPGRDPLNVYLYGPPGTGKTTLAMHAADELGVSFGCISLSPMPASAKIIGFTDANGRVTRTAFREAFENGGLFLFDEIDAGNAGDLTIINAALANRVCAFPDKVVKAHPRFYAIAAANTLGKGADENHTGRVRLDSATTDRFERVHVPIDEAFERRIALEGVPADRLAECSKVVDLVQGIRAKVGDVHLVSPRASISAVRLTLAGFSHAEIIDMRILADANDSVRERAGFEKVNR